MNRRSFMLSLGMMACSSTATTTTKRRKKAPRPPEPPSNGGVVDLVWFESQLRASTLALRENLLVQSLEGQLRSWDTRTMQRKDTWSVPHRHFCFVQDGSIIAFGWPEEGTSSVIHRITNGKVRSIEGPILPRPGRNVVLPAREADEFYLTSQENIYLIGATGDLKEILQHPGPNEAARDQWVSFGDGRIIGMDREGGLHLIASKAQSYPYPTRGREILHLAAATGERVWYSYAELKDDWNAHTLILAAVDRPMEAVRTLEVAPARVVHLASFGDTLAALLFTMGSSRDDVEWNVVVFDETGHERWRVKVPTDFGPGAGLNHAFVAIGEHRVVLASFDGRLLAWDAADGKPVG